MPDISDEVVGSLGVSEEGTHDVTEPTNLPLGYTTVPVLMALYATSAVGSPTVGTVKTLATGVVPSIASGAALGTVTISLGPIASGIPSTSMVGVASTVAFAPVTGFAFTGDVGTPRGALVMSPVGIAGSDAVGTPETTASIVVIPGAIDPSDGFGDATVTKKGWVFRPPVNTYKWRLFKEYEGISLLKENGVWSEVAHPDLVRTRAAERYLAGGRDHVVGDALKAELVALGYSVTEEFVTTEEYL